MVSPVTLPARCTLTRDHATKKLRRAKVPILAKARSSDSLPGFADHVVQALSQPLNGAHIRRYTYPRVAANQRCYPSLGSAVGKPRNT